MGENKRKFEWQKGGHLGEMENNPFEWITCAPSVSQNKDGPV